MEEASILQSARIENMIRLVASDLDGTLLSSKGTISVRTALALQSIQQAGIVFVLVSARPPRFLRHMVQNIGMTGLAICCNGAIIYDLDQDTIIRHVPLQPTLAESLIYTLRREIPGIYFGCECGLDYQCEPDFYRLCGIKEAFDPTINDALIFCKEPLTKLIALHPDYTAEELNILINSFANNEEVIATHSGTTFVEISAAGVHKASALEALCKDLNILPHEVIAFGDMPNDIAMLHWAGHSVAVANAHPSVHEIVDEITPSNDEDGVAIVLERLLAARE